MGNAWKCDKCGHYFDKPIKHEIRTYEDDSAFAKKYFLLCEGCKQRFDKWIEDKPLLGTDWTFLVVDESGYLSTDSLPYGWPTFEDGTPIKEWDEVLDNRGHGFVAHNFSHYGKWWTVSSGHGYGVMSDTSVFKRPTKEQMAEYYKKWPKDKKERVKYVINTDGTVWSTINYMPDGGLNLADDVNHPKHYDNGKVECINWIKLKLTPEEFKGYLKGCALKYQFRYEDKENPAKDLQKAQWYLKKLLEELA